MEGSRKYSLKQVIVVRGDLKISKGKLAVQVAHAAVSAFYKTLTIKPEYAKLWLEEGQPKIVCKVNSLNEFKEIIKKLQESNLLFEVIIDAGLTELPPNTVTCIGIGPAPREEIDRITGSLKLL